MLEVVVPTIWHQTSNRIVLEIYTKWRIETMVLFFRSFALAPLTQPSICEWWFASLQLCRREKVRIVQRRNFNDSGCIFSHQGMSCAKRRSFCKHQVVQSSDKLRQGCTHKSLV